MTAQNDSDANVNLRTQAETILSATQVLKQPLSPEDMERALHELRVHQIELEMQNEELRRTHLELDDAHSNYFDLYDLAPVGYCTVDESGRILQANLMACSLLGMTRDSLNQQLFSRFICKEDKDLDYLLRKKILNTEQTQSCELRIHQHNGNCLWVQLQGSVTRDDANTPLFRIVITDISARKTLEIQTDLERDLLEYLAVNQTLPDVLNHFVLRYEALFEGMHGSVLLLDASGKHLLHGVAPHLPSAYCRALEHVEIGPDVGSCGTAAFTGKDVFVADIAHDPLWREFKVLALQFGLRACWSVPIFGIKSQVLGTFAFYFKESRLPLAHEIALIKRGAHLASLAIERQRTHEALQASEERYSNILKTAMYGFLLIDTHGKILDANETYCRMSGFRADELKSCSIADLEVCESADDISAHIQQIIFEGEDRFESQHRRKNGQMFDVEVSVQYRPANQDQLVVFVQDITARKLAEAKLRLSEESLAITLNSIGDAVIATDATGRITRMNATAERLTGWPLAAATGLALEEVFHIIHAQTRQKAPSPIEMVMQQGKVVGLLNHTALIARNGYEYQIADSAAPIRDPEGGILGVVLVFSDVTEDYRVRQDLASTAEMLERTGEMAKVGGWELDLKTMEHFWSRETCRILDVDPPVAPPYSEGIRFFPSESQPIIMAALENGSAYGTPWDLEIPALTAKGRPIWVRTQGSAIIEQGKPVKLLGALHDITQRKHTEEALLMSLLEKEALLKEVHHRVKNNLQVITSLLRLEGNRCSERDTESVLKDMQGRIRSMALLHEMLYRSGTFAAVDLGAYLKQLCTQAFRALIPKPGAIRLELDLDSFEVGMDQATPCGLLVNELVSNCIKHGFPDGHSGEVRVALHPVDGGPQLCLQISDTGVGLPPDIETRKNNSLGLQLVADLALQLGGTLTSGPGTLFTLCFIADVPKDLTQVA